MALRLQPGHGVAVVARVLVRVLAVEKVWARALAWLEVVCSEALLEQKAVRRSHLHCNNGYRGYLLTKAKPEQAIQICKSRPIPTCGTGCRCGLKQVNSGRGIGKRHHFQPQRKFEQIVPQGLEG